MNAFTVEQAIAIQHKLERGICAQVGRVSGFLLILMPPEGVGQATIITNCPKPEAVLADGLAAVLAEHELEKVAH